MLSCTRKGGGSRRPPAALLILLVLFALALGPMGARTALAEGRYGVGVSGGLSYDPGDARDFFMVHGMALFDYEEVWKHPAPEPLRFKVEIAVGSTLEDAAPLVNAGIFALWYLRGLETENCRPYVEGGIGGIWSGYSVDGQSERLNFNPQLGIGMEIRRKGGEASPLFVALRLNHASNAGLSSGNRGRNAVAFLAGVYF